MALDRVRAVPARPGGGDLGRPGGREPVRLEPRGHDEHRGWVGHPGAGRGRVPVLPMRARRPPLLDRRSLGMADRGPGRFPYARLRHEGSARARRRADRDLSATVNLEARGGQRLRSGNVRQDQERGPADRRVVRRLAEPVLDLQAERQSASPGVARAIRPSRGRRDLHPPGSRSSRRYGGNAPDRAFAACRARPALIRGEGAHARGRHSVEPVTRKPSARSAGQTTPWAKRRP